MTIIIDTRERIPWNFTTKADCIQIVKKLDTGDYTLLGFEDKFVIERKYSISEIAINFGSGWKRFQKELDRMQAFERRYIICEFTIDDVLNFPINSGIPRSKWQYLKLSGKFLMSRFDHIREQYKVEIIFCGSKLEAEKTVHGIFLDVTKQTKS